MMLSNISSSIVESKDSTRFVVKPSWLCSNVRSKIFEKEGCIHYSEAFINDSHDKDNNADDLFEGLFAAVDLEENQEIGSYYGDILTTSQAIKVPDKSYLMRIGEQCYLNSNDNHKECLMRYINDCRNPAGYNVKFIKYPELKLAKVVTIRPIQCHEEIFADYGKWYWLSSQASVRLTFGQLHKLKTIECCN